jgi:hypothetical protein
MPALIPPQTVLTPADAANQLQAKGLDALGLVIPNLASAWGDDIAASYDQASLRLTVTSPRAAFRAPLRFEAQPTVWSDVSGAPVAGPVAALVLHPEAARRLASLLAWRLGSQPQVRPVPVAMLVHGISMPTTPQPVDWFSAGADLGFTGQARAISFHDARGLPIDPVAVAALFRDLLGALPALRIDAPGAPAQASAAGLDQVAAKAGGMLCHVVDPHGRPYVPTRDFARLRILDSGGSGPYLAPGLFTLDAGKRLGRSSQDDVDENAALQGTGRQPALYWGWACNATLARTPLEAPAAAVALGRQFLRVMAVDLDWHLLGNRTSGSLNEVPGDDDKVPDFALPVVRPAVPNFDYLPDAMDALGACAQVAAGFPPAGQDVMALLASPAIDPALALPSAPGASAHWPLAAGVPAGGALPPLLDVTHKLAAVFRTPADGPGARLDVIVKFHAEAGIPAGIHLRVYPRRFVEIDAIGEEPSFVRGDGGAAIAGASTDQVLLVNPFGLKAADPLPAPARLLVDVVATAPNGQRRLHSGVELMVGTAAQAWTDNSADFGGSAVLQRPAVATLLSGFGATAVAPASLFGIPPATPPAGGSPSGIVDLVRRLANETTAPRQGPHLPTQGRFDTVWAVGSAPSGQPLGWRAVLTGARWTRESRSAQPQLGNPGNPGGPDLHAAGIRADGQLAYDLALHALKRAQPIIPLSGGTPGWLVATGGNNWSDPPPDPATGTVAAAMLETVAPFCDSPELGVSAIPVPQPTDTIQGAVNALAATLGVPAPTINVANEARLRRELQREMITAMYGQRDALWALVRAIHDAREFVYIESPQFSRTARPGMAPAAHEIDLVEALLANMKANPRLKLMICVPRVPDFASAKANWVRAALGDRTEALTSLISPYQARVAAFHPIGFPGRHAQLRSTVVIVDDVWALVGTSHLRRRGMTFDGAADVVSIDRRLNGRGTSAGIASFRQELMASKLGVPVPAGPDGTSALWTRLAEPEGAFDVLSELLAAGGLGRCTPVWAGPTDTRVEPQKRDVADPDGVDSDGSRLLSLFGTLLLDS